MVDLLYKIIKHIPHISQILEDIEQEDIRVNNKIKRYYNNEK